MVVVEKKEKQVALKEDMKLVVFGKAVSVVESGNEQSHLRDLETWQLKVELLEFKIEGLLAKAVLQDMMVQTEATREEAAAVRFAADAAEAPPEVAIVEGAAVERPKVEVAAGVREADAAADLEGLYECGVSDLEKLKGESRAVLEHLAAAQARLSRKRGGIQGSEKSLAVIEARLVRTRGDLVKDREWADKHSCRFGA